ncbi:MAG: hypothetical protein DPW09_17905 [Anaerolineae bacterium]|nr:hypothetical protein [Anaerolineae bacterium]
MSPGSKFNIIAMITLKKLMIGSTPGALSLFEGYLLKRNSGVFQNIGCGNRRPKKLLNESVNPARCERFMSSRGINLWGVEMVEVEVGVAVAIQTILTVKGILFGG